jgi:4-hydroxy-tetrahydrodipicolinate reductase
MGRSIASLVATEPDLEVVSAWEAEGVARATPDYGVAAGYAKNDVRLTSDGLEAAGLSDVVIDFASSSVFDRIVEVCGELRKPLVTGTTGIPDKEARLESLAQVVTVVSAPNMAIGVNVVFGLCESLGEVLGKISDIEIIETHHRTKKDVPSGTALKLGRIMEDVTGKPVVVGRGTDVSDRRDDIVIHSLRTGDVAGKHRIVFAPKGEVVEITHTAQSRACFAAGALQAARFAVESPAGLYDMQDVLGLK